MEQAVKYVEGQCPKCGQPMGEVPDPMPEGWLCFLCQAKLDEEEARDERIRAEIAANPPTIRSPWEPREPPPPFTLPDTRSKKQKWAIHYALKRKGL